MVPGTEVVEYVLPMLVAACDRSYSDASLELQALCAAGLASGFGVRCDIVSLLNWLLCLPPKLTKLTCCQPGTLR